MKFSYTVHLTPSDARQYLKIGYNLAHHGMFSLGSDADSLTPTNYREPGYPFYLAVVIRVIPPLFDASQQELLDGGRKTLILKYAQIPLLLTTAVLASLLSWRLIRRWQGSLAVFLLVGFSPSLFSSAISLNSEHLAALFLLLFSWAVMCFWERMSFRRAALVGLTGGLLILTKAVFLYLLPILFAVSIPVLWRGRRVLITKTIAPCLAFLAVASLMVGSWMMRNERQLGELRLAARSGVVLLVRAEKNMMKIKEYLGSFLYWTPYTPIRDGLIRVLYGPHALEQGGALERLNRDNEASFYRIARKVRSDLAIAAGGEVKAVDDELKRRAFEKIWTHPFMHVALTIPFAWRGMFVEGTGLPGHAGLFRMILSICYVFAFAALLYRCLFKEDWPLLGLLLPSFYIFGIHACLTHNLTRFNVPTIPMLAIVLVLFLNDYLTRRGSNEGNRTDTVL